MNKSLKIHFQILNKFSELRGKEFTKFVGVFTNATPDKYVSATHHLLSRQRGVYVPASYDLAYSIKIDSTSENYYNKVSYSENGFIIKYFLPNDIADGQKERDRNALYKNYIDEIPIGIVLKEAAGYRILGLGEITSFFNEYIIVEPFLSNIGSGDILKEEKEVEKYRITEAKYLTKVRLMQSIFRKEVLNHFGKKCLICDIDQEELLVASHIKPWRKSSDKERLDKYNGLPLCNNHDALFDRGLISFNENNELLTSSRLTEDQVVAVNITPGKKFSFDSVTESYLKYHLKNLFIK
ncbi:HNH endonuclease [Lacicoccus alkaliphilus]|uniref:HNH endonuclease n=1 Tax=Lacicoccus alkaliphilus DSM 16010 TaxID=1123231 RepID=A0A1M7KK20_9BACL|nr:HNH endonuclease [Salinicoccus alkaliphilus]SHM65622.1 HNH endonuclease [Salinicoccus alkaliphilus DSM 16010]